MAPDPDTDYYQLNFSQYAKEYRKLLGFTNQSVASDFLGAKDITPPISEPYTNALIARLREIVQKIQLAVRHPLNDRDIREFFAEKIDSPVAQIREHGFLPRMNNQGRRPEDVLFSWLRGHVTAKYFIADIQRIFEIARLDSIGDDDFTREDTFKRSPKADYVANHPNGAFRVELQCGFQKNSDIKQHKVLEAKRVFDNEGVATVCVHLDIFNGQCAFVRLDTIDGDDVNWVTRTQMEGQLVLAIDQNYFKWRLADRYPDFDDLELAI